MSFYASWGPDPGTIYLDVFSITWETQFFYGISPFSLITHCLHKIAKVEAEGITIVPFGLSSHIQLVHRIVDVPRAYLHQLIMTMLTIPGKFRPLIKTMFLMASRLSGNPLNCREFFKRAGDIILQFWRHGTLRQYSSYITKWIHFVVTNKLIVFPPLYSKH